MFGQLRVDGAEALIVFFKLRVRVALDIAKLADDEREATLWLGKLCVVLVQPSLQLSDLLLDVHGHACRYVTVRFRSMRVTSAPDPTSKPQPEPTPDELSLSSHTLTYPENPDDEHIIGR